MKLPAGYETDRVAQLETNLDDLSPEILGAVMEKLLSAGALDVWFTSIQMKKNRPGTQLSLLCAEGEIEALAEILFTETTAFGLRISEVVRLKLERRFEQVHTEFGEVRIKIGSRAARVLQVAPEFESCRALSEKAGQPLRTIYEAALRAYSKNSVHSHGE